MGDSWLKQSTSVSVLIGPIWSTSDGALKADLAYNASGINCDVYKNGTKADVTLANSAVDGYFRAASGEALYLLTLSTGHTDTLGRLEISLSATGYYMKPRSYMIVPANVWDSLFGADYLKTEVVEISGDSAAADNLESYCDGTTPIPANATQIAGSAVATGSAQLGVNVVNWKGSAAAAMTGDAYARLGAPAGASVSADVADVESKVDDLEGRLTATRAGYLDNLSAAPPSASTIAAAVRDVNNTTPAASSLGAAVNSAASAGDPCATAVPGSYGAGTLGYLVGTNLTAKVGDVKAKTDNLPADPADDSDIDAQLAAIAGYLDTEVAAILAAVDTEVAAIKAKTDNLPANTATVLGTPAGASLAADIATLVAAVITNAAGADVSADVAACKAILDILKVIAANKSIENEAGTSVTYRNDADSANAGTQSWTEATKTRGAYTPA